MPRLSHLKHRNNSGPAPGTICVSALMRSNLGRRTVGIGFTARFLVRRSAILRNEKRSDLIGAIAGAAFVLLLFLSVASLDLPRGKPDQELQTWWADEGLRRASIVSMYLMLLAAPCFLVFLTRLCARLREVDVEDSWNALVQGAGIVFVALLSVSAVTRGVIAQAVRFNDEPVPGVDTLRY